MNAQRAIGLAASFLAVVAVASATLHAGYPYVGLFGDVVGSPGGSGHYNCNVFAPAPFTDVEMWIWFFPDPSKGLSSVDFRLVYPTSTYVTQGAVTSNPLNAVEVGTLTGGINVEVGAMNCQYDWYYTHHQVLTLKRITPIGWAAIVADPNLVAPPFDVVMKSCEPGFPSYACMKAGDLALNIGCAICIDFEPMFINDVTVEDFTVVRAHFDYLVFAFECTSMPYRNHFIMYNKAVPTDTMEIVEAVREVQNGCATYALNLDTPMVDGTTYVVEARSISTCGCDAASANSTWEFTFDKRVATLLQSSSASLRGSGIEVAWTLAAIDQGTSFFVSRSENGGDFKMLDGSALARDGLKFTYVDRSTEPGKTYSYKVEYGVGAPSRVLFISETISTPAMPLTLYQNKPNPFNPSTTISFYVPQESVVGLEVYDILGRLVSRLIGGERRSAGTYNVEWNGRDARGAAVSSGVYFYRLTAGKETVSKKMVLLR